jgi:hypothetical protein
MGMTVVEIIPPGRIFRGGIDIAFFGSIFGMMDRTRGTPRSA